MQKINIFILIFYFLFNISANSELIEIKVKVHGEVITNLDIKNEINYLTFLNPKLGNLEKTKVFSIAKNSLITEIVKKEELKKFTNLDKENSLINLIENNLLRKKNIENRDAFKKILIERNLNYEEIKKKLLIETLWNQLIYQKYSKNLVINRE